MRLQRIVVIWALCSLLVVTSGCDSRTNFLGDGDTSNKEPPHLNSDSDSDSDTNPDTDSGSDSDSHESKETETSTEYIDKDNDGWVENFDCDDDNPNVNPGVEEQIDPPNGVDDDCDGLTDESSDDSEKEYVRSSTIWIANSPEGTLSKINTRTMKHRGRYWVRPEKNGSPSRTSVNGNGDVVVASRHPGAVTMFREDEKKCIESNGKPGIQTSTGANDILDWDTEECRGWYRDFSSFNSCRTVAWTSGTYDRETKRWNDPKVWLACSPALGEGTGVVYLLNGDNGTTEMEIPISYNNLYGGVVDSENNLWMGPRGIIELVKVDRKTGIVKAWSRWRDLSYGIAVDEKGRIWLCDRKVSRFDPATESWKISSVIRPETPHTPWGWSGSCSPDGKGNLWVSRGEALVAIDIDTLDIKNLIRIPIENVAQNAIWGVAVDVDGFLWAVPRDGNEAYRVDPITHAHRTVGGLVKAYTYSDMTGFLLGLTSPPVQ